MKLHRFYIYDMQLSNTLDISQPQLLHQWSRVLRFRPGREIELFNSTQETARYTFSSIDEKVAVLQKTADVEGILPRRHIALCFALLKKDKTDWVLQKATELGVSELRPVVTDRTEKTGFNVERAQKILVEAAEQSGRSSVPKLLDPVDLRDSIKELQMQGDYEIHVADQFGGKNDPRNDNKVAIFVGPEGGWSDQENEFFAHMGIQQVSISQFTLRAETAAITAVACMTLA